MSVSNPTALPDNGGVFTGANLAQIQANVATDIANNAAVNAALFAAGGIAPSQLAPTILQYATIPLTLAQIIASNSVPIPLLAAQGTGTMIEVVSLTLDLIRGSAAFSGGGAMAAYQGTTSAGVLATATIAATVFTTFPASQIIRVAGAQAVAASSTVLNVGLVFTNPTADFTSGTGATGIVKLVYRVHTGLS